MLYSQLWHMRIHIHTQWHRKKNSESLFRPQHEFDALFQGVQYRKIITRFRQFIITPYKKPCARSQNSKGKRLPISHTPPPFFKIFFGVRLEDKWCRARAPRTKVGPTFGEEHRGRYTPRNTGKVHIICNAAIYECTNRPPRTKWLNARIPSSSHQLHQQMT